jgi:hypothetical protein
LAAFASTGKEKDGQITKICRTKETAHTKAAHLGKENRSKLLIAFAFALHLSFSGQRHQI